MHAKTFRVRTETAVRCARHYQGVGDSLQQFLIAADLGQVPGTTTPARLNAPALPTPLAPALPTLRDDPAEATDFAGLTAHHAHTTSAPHAVLTIQRSVYRMAAAYLRAGGANAEADRMNRLALSTTTD
ncbi:hypothetical protein EBN03_16350 [Nocardia stercoris]|uniref:Uncharacterized protein n=1 Tax=Nocardia stercoris TaxID=2483361 RepID=A0A3M2L2Z7_9NOCA|nr:hypothetical protein EBN03_16350 [Nocardia stercoris]